jgi:hypothetical protein
MDGNGTANSYQSKHSIVINSSPVLDLHDTGDIYIEFRWASPLVCWGTVIIITLVY